MVTTNFDQATDLKLLKTHVLAQFKINKGEDGLFLNTYINFEDMHWTEEYEEKNNVVNSNVWDFSGSLWSWSWRYYQIRWNERSIDWFFAVDASDDNKGQLTFSQPVNMVWLEANFSSFFKLTTVTGSGEEAVEAVVADLKFDKADDDNKVVDLSWTGFSSATQRLYAAIAMNEG